jgi:anaerobic selenocysteine-containing dehydrogenase
MIDEEEFPLHALTQRPMQMYHSWGSQNAWLRQITGSNKMYIGRKLAERLEIGEGDWIRVTSHHGTIKAPAAVMDGVNDDTIWTWNAIGKRAGAWNLDPKAGEARKGFLLNHVISELLPARGDGHRYTNTDPATGQAAWYDLRVKVEKVVGEHDAVSEPQFDVLQPPEGLKERPAILRYGMDFRRGRGER